ncbi:hypothetical protein Tco_0865277, partial [Tanacetum coccineum]
MTNLTEMLSKFVNSNTASSSSSGSLPSNMITNPKEDLKGITTRSGVAYQGPTIPTTSSPKVVGRKTKVTKDTVFPTNNGITEDAQPPVVPFENQNPVSEPVDAPVSAPMPNPKPSIPYPSRQNDEKRREKANDAILRNMQNQGQGLQNQMTNLTEILSKFVHSNTASTSSSGSLPSNTVTNPKDDLKGITTRSGVAYQGHAIPITSSPKVVERRTEVTKDTVFPTNNGITEDVQPPVVPTEKQIQFLSQMLFR